MTWIADAQQLVERSSKLASQATPGPWYKRAADDEVFMTAYYITNREGPAEVGTPDEWDHQNAIVAVTLLQEPAMVVPEEYEENTAFLVAVRTDVPRLCTNLRRALSLLQESAELLDELLEADGSVGQLVADRAMRLRDSIRR